MKIWGWIHGRKFFDCNSHEHFESLRDTDVKLPGGVIDVLDSIIKVRLYCEENDEWHFYENSTDEFGADIYGILIDAGWIRVGSMRDGDIIRIHFQGSPQSLKNDMQFMKDLAESEGGEAHFEPMKSQ